MTNLDRTDSFNYHAAVLSGSTVLLVSLNSRSRDRAKLDEFIRIASNRALAAKVVTS